ncbi:MAG: M15 family metallopeptidase [Bryobacterales bacterium]|nr:M15 family metallopeptidase [Bryobacterales bacterium]
MDDLELQRHLKDLRLFSGSVDGTLNADSFVAIDAFLNFGSVNVPRSWSRARRALAAKQLVCRQNGIDVGAIDGLMGPQTAFAFEVYEARQQGKPEPIVAARNRRAPTAPSPAPGAMVPPWPRQAGVEAFYGAIGDNQIGLDLPYPMRIAWDTSKVIRRFPIHEKVHDSAQRCLEQIAKKYNGSARSELGLDLFGGCLNVRRMRGGSAWSMHSWGIAIDFDPTRNSLHSNRNNARLAQPDCNAFWEIWEAEGWLSLGRARNFDWMHVQAAHL